MPIYFGHRGNEKDYIENTICAINNCKFEGIEVDVRITADYQIILHHDPTFERIYNVPFFVKEMEVNDIIKKFKTVVTLNEFLKYASFNKKKIIIDIKELLYHNICYIIDYCINFCKKNNYDINNIIFLSWITIIKPRKNIKFFRASNYDYINKEYIRELKNDSLFDGVCLKYTGTNDNLRCINRIKKNNMEVNVYIENNINVEDIIDNNIDYITL